MKVWLRLRRVCFYLAGQGSVCCTVPQIDAEKCTIQRRPATHSKSVCAGHQLWMGCGVRAGMDALTTPLCVQALHSPGAAVIREQPWLAITWVLRVYSSLLS